MDQELSVAIRTGDGRLGPADDVAAVGFERVGDLGSHAIPDHRVADDAPPFAHLGATGLELGFDQEHHVGPRLAHRHQRRDDQAERDEGQVTDDEVDRAADRVDIDVADVRALQVGDTSVRPQTLVQLIVTDVESHDVGGAPLQHTVGETARRRTGIEYTEIGNVDHEDVEGMIELLCPTADKPGGRPDDEELIIRSDLSRRLVGDGAVDRDAVCVYEMLRFRSTRNEPTSNEFGVEATTAQRITTCAWC